ncbi:hypothetical protein FRC07_002193, partial [Ceratobasidium sp. 392]
VNFTQSTRNYMWLELPKPKDKAGCSSGAPVTAQHLHNVNPYDRGVTGDHHFSVWHPKGHQYSDSYTPMQDTTQSSSNAQWSSRMCFFDSNWSVDCGVACFIQPLWPQMALALDTAHGLVAKHPGFHPFNSVWHTQFLGCAMIVNRETGKHLDWLGVRRTWDVIVAAGDFSGGEFHFCDMNQFCLFLPGDMVTFDGTAQRHQIQTFTGQLRLSHIYFIHQSVLTEPRINTHMPNVHLSDLVSSLACFNCLPAIQGPLPPPGLAKHCRRKDTGLELKQEKQHTNATEFTMKLEGGLNIQSSATEPSLIPSDLLCARSNHQSTNSKQHKSNIWAFSNLQVDSNHLDLNEPPEDHECWCGYTREADDQYVEDSEGEEEDLDLEDLDNDENVLRVNN